MLDADGILSPSFVLTLLQLQYWELVYRWRWEAPRRSVFVTHFKKFHKLHWKQTHTHPLKYNHSSLLVINDILLCYFGSNWIKLGLKRDLIRLVQKLTKHTQHLLSQSVFMIIGLLGENTVKHRRSFLIQETKINCICGNS